jgi:quercetin dioxygenase-like cupin family protein
MTASATFQHHRWEDLPEEGMGGAITRRFVAGGQAMVAEISLKAGDVAPRHSHPNEQVTCLLSGAMRFQLGAAGEHELVARAGEILVIPADLPHGAEALEDTRVLDIFAPPRQDWLAGVQGYPDEER